MLKIKNALIAVVAMFAIVSCSTTYETKINFDKNMEVNTQEYKTFSWLTKGKIMSAAVDFNPVMKVKIDKAIEDAFIAKGYKLLAIEDEEKADFTISYTVGNREKIKVSSYPSTYATGFGWGHGYYGGRHGGMYGTIGMGTETQVRQYTEGKLAIDVYDVKSHQPAWHGWGVKRITSDDKETPNATIKSIVEQVVGQFK